MMGNQLLGISRNLHIETESRSPKHALSKVAVVDFALSTSNAILVDIMYPGALAHLSETVREQDLLGALSFGY
jgi:hypothetical protein